MPTLPLQGVYIDGSIPPVVIPQPQPQRLAQGTDAVFRMAVLGSLGSAWDLTGWTAFVLTVRVASASAPLVAARQGTVQGAPTLGIVTFPIHRADTLAVAPQECSFDVWATDPAGGLQPLVPLSQFTLSPAIGPGAPVTP